MFCATQMCVIGQILSGGKVFEVVVSKLKQKLKSLNFPCLPVKMQLNAKEFQMILRFFLVITMYCQASSSQFNHSLNLPRC